MQAAPWPTAAVGLEEVGPAKAVRGVRVQHFTINRVGTLRTERNLGRDEMFVALRVTCWGRLRIMLEILFLKSGMLKALFDHFRTYGIWFLVRNWRRCYYFLCFVDTLKLHSFWEFKECYVILEKQLTLLQWVSQISSISFWVRTPFSSTWGSSLAFYLWEVWRKEE